MRRRPRTEAGAAAVEADERTVRTAALALLAGRDFSRHELTGRLLRKGYGAQVVDAAVAALVQEGFLREQRYVEQYIVHHAGRGHGPVRIRIELREKGVAAEAIDEALEAAETDWVHSAREARRRKFGLSPPGDYRERARQARFLQYRGFSSEQIRAALGPGEDDDSDRST
ncbi:MAG TPA: regulatory protein RecX [Steroidobacteraceae bacterium]